MFYKFVEALNPITNPQDIRMPAGLYAGVMIHWSGTAETAVTAAQTDFGTILVRHRGRNIVNARARDIYVWDELAGGYANWVTTEAAAVDLVIFVPFRYGDMPSGSDDNLLNCGPDELFVSVPALDAAKFATMNCTIGWVGAPGVARYVVQISTQSLATISLNQPVRLQIPNLQDILIDDEDITTEPTSVFLTRNSRVMFEGPYNDLQAFSDLAWYREAAGIDACMVRMGRDDFPSFVGGRYDLRLIGGIGNAHVCEFGALPISSEEFHAVRAVQDAALNEQYSSSPEPPAADVAPAAVETANASAGTSEDFAKLGIHQAPRMGPSVVVAPGVRVPGPRDYNRFVGRRRVGL